MEIIKEKENQYSQARKDHILLRSQKIFSIILDYILYFLQISNTNIILFEFFNIQLRTSIV